MLLYIMLFHCIKVVKVFYNYFPMKNEFYKNKNKSFDNYYQLVLINNKLKKKDNYIAEIFHENKIYL